MSYLDELKSKYGDLKAVNKKHSYEEATKKLKEKLDKAASIGKRCCRFWDYPNIIDDIKTDPEFSGFDIKPADLPPDDPDQIAVLVCWLY